MGRIWRLAIACFLLAAPALAQIPPRPPDALLLDLSKTLKPDTVASLGNGLKTFQQTNHRALAVVVVKRLASFRMGNSIQALALIWFDQWNLDSSDALLLVSLDDHQARIQMGKAWGNSADPRCRQIMDGIVERFKAKDVDGGIVQGSNELETTVLNAAPPPIVEAPAPPPVAPSGPPGLVHDMLVWAFSGSLFPWQWATIIALGAFVWGGLALFFTPTWRQENRKLHAGLACLLAAGAAFAVVFWIAMAIFVVVFVVYCARNSSDSPDDPELTNRYVQTPVYSSSDSYSGGGGGSQAAAEPSSPDAGGATGNW